MKKMNFVKEIRSNTVKELLAQRQDFYSKNFKLRMDINFNRSGNTAQIKNNRKKIAQINTVINQNIYSSKEDNGK